VNIVYSVNVYTYKRTNSAISSLLELIKCSILLSQSHKNGPNPFSGYMAYKAIKPDFSFFMFVLSYSIF